MFTIPELSFKKEHAPCKYSASDIPNTLNRFKDVKQSPAFLSSLTGFIPNHADSAESETTKISLQNNTDSQSFNSLAALTAHHLQKSNAISNIGFRENQSSPNSQFVIPKLSIKKDNSEATTSTQLSTFREHNKNKQISSMNKQPIDSLQADFSNMRIFPNSAMTNLELKGQSQSTINQISAPHDKWMVDLSVALKEAEFLILNTSDSISSDSNKLDHEIPNLELRVDDKSDIMPNLLPVTLNLSAVRRTNLPYTKLKVSVFGQTLCRQWKTKRPNLKVFVQHHNTIKPFDFSIPYTRNTNRSQ